MKRFILFLTLVHSQSRSDIDVRSEKEQEMNKQRGLELTDSSGDEDDAGNNWAKELIKPYVTKGFRTIRTTDWADVSKKFVKGTIEAVKGTIEIVKEAVQESRDPEASKVAEHNIGILMQNLSL